MPAGSFALVKEVEHDVFAVGGRDADLDRPGKHPMSPVPGSPFAKMVAPRATLRVFMYEPRCSITAGGRSRNSEWLRSRDNLSRGRSAGRLPPGIDMRASPITNEY